MTIFPFYYSEMDVLKVLSPVQTIDLQQHGLKLATLRNVPVSNILKTFKVHIKATKQEGVSS